RVLHEQPFHGLSGWGRPRSAPLVTFRLERQATVSPAAWRLVQRPCDACRANRRNRCELGNRMVGLAWSGLEQLVIWPVFTLAGTTRDRRSLRAFSRSRSKRGPAPTQGGGGGPSSEAGCSGSGAEGPSGPVPDSWVRSPRSPDATS